MKKQIAGIPSCTNRHYNCVYVVLDSLLRFHGHEPTVACFSNWDFVYRRDGGRFAIDGRSIPLPKILGAFGVGLFNRSADDVETAWKAVRALIDTDTPVAVSLDVFPLARSGLYPRLRHADHQYIAAGYDDEAGTVHLIDPSPWQPSARDLPLGLFLASWDMSEFSGVGNRYNWTWLKAPAQPPHLAPGPVQALLRRNLRSMSATSGQAGLALGLEGIERLAEDAGGWARYEEPRLRRHLRRCAELLLEIAVLREGHGHFLGHLGRLFYRPGLAGLGGDLESISQGWFVVKSLCLKGALKEPASLLPRIRTRLRDIGAREREALAGLAGEVERWSACPARGVTPTTHG